MQHFFARPMRCSSSSPSSPLSLGHKTSDSLVLLLQNAARANDVHALLGLIKLGTPINSISIDNDWTPLHAAVALNNAVTVSVLLRHGADPNTRDASGDTPLITAASHGFTEVTQQLICKCNMAQTSVRGDTALHAAAEAGFESIASLLIARGGEALITATNQLNQTARQIALNNGHVDIVTLIDGHMKSRRTDDPIGAGK